MFLFVSYCSWGDQLQDFSTLKASLSSSVLAMRRGVLSHTYGGLKVRLHSILHAETSAL